MNFEFVSIREFGPPKSGMASAQNQEARRQAQQLRGRCATARQVHDVLKAEVSANLSTGVGQWRWLVRVCEDDQLGHIEIIIDVPDSRTHAPGRVALPVSIPPFTFSPAVSCLEANTMTIYNIISWFREQCLTVVLHEFDETFMVRGKLLNDPHKFDKPRPWGNL